MKFSCEKALLYESINDALHAASTKSTIPALEGILITASDGLELSGYNLEIGIRTRTEADVSDPGACVISAKLFAGIVRQLDDDLVFFETDETGVAEIRCGLSKFNIPTMPAADFPALPVVSGEKTVLLRQKLLKEMIAKTVFAVSANDTKPIFTGALFDVCEDVLRVVAADNYRGIAMREEDVLHTNKERSFRFVVPGSTLREIEKMLGDSEDPVELSLSQKHILFSFDNASVVSRLLEGDFLKYEKYIPEESPVSMTVDARELARKAERVSVINEKLTSPLKCVFQEGSISLSARSFGNSKDECAAEGNGRGTVMGLNYRYLVDALRAVDGEKTKIELSSGMSPLLIRPTEGRRYTYLIMPMRISADNG